jgi:hypothetical protein
MNEEAKKNRLTEIIYFCISNKSLEFTDEQFTVPNDFIENKSIVFHANEKYSINHKSEITNSLLLKIAEEKLNKKLPIDFSNAIKFVKEFENEIKKPETNISWAGLIDLTNGLSAFAFAKLHNENAQNLPEFLFQQLELKEKREHHLFAIEKYFSFALPHLNIGVEQLLMIIKRHVSSSNSLSSIINFSKDLALAKPDLANKLFDLIVSDKENIDELKVIPASLLIGLYNSAESLTFTKAVGLYEKHSVQTIYFLGRIDYHSIDHLKTALELAIQVEKDNILLLHNCIDIYSNVLKNQFVDQETKAVCFNKLQDTFEVENQELKNTILYFFSHWIDGYENERNLFLLKNFSTIENKDFIKHYFDNFKDALYFFDFFQKIYKALDQKVNMEYFESGLSHFWRTDQEKTENTILHFLSDESIEWRKAGVKLLKSHRHEVYRVNVLKLALEIEQLRCLEVLTYYNLSFESFLPIILPFRNSTYLKVRRELQNILSQLVYESYHDSLYNLIISSLSTSKSDKSFIIPIKKALDAYHELVKLKDSVKDLDPVQNERNYIDLYYRLEHENKAKMMDSIKNEKSSLMTLFGKSKIIVRGHSWKLEDSEQVSPLGKIEHSVMIDNRAFKNTELFENNMKNPKTKY